MSLSDANILVIGFGTALLKLAHITFGPAKVGVGLRVAAAFDDEVQELTKGPGGQCV